MQELKKSKHTFNFSEILLKWNKEINKRMMPWKNEKNPYKIWLSEIILQQTRVEQGLKYYEQFTKSFPTVHDLANAPEQSVYKLWEGLGYYTRCANLIKTAHYISKELKGKFPCSHDEIKKLKGIGPYTAAAIASFAFNEPHAVVDGNVFRVLSRIFFIKKPIDSTEGKKFFTKLATELLDKKHAGLYNQAIMDFGATVCKSVPLCDHCPFNKNCQAFLNNKVLSFPVKNKKNVIHKRWFNYLLLEYRGKIALQKRIEKDIWKNLFQFLLIESDSALNEDELLVQLKKNKWISKNSFEIKSVSRVFKQQLSHQLIEGRFIKLKLHRQPILPKDVFWITKNNISNYAFPQLINQYLQTELK